MRLVTIIFILSTVLFAAQDQQPEGVLIGTTDLKEQHLYAVAPSIVQTVAGSESNLVCRIFISKITKSDCCDPVWVGGDCFRCCDNPNDVVCTKNGFVKGIVARIKGVSESEWQEARISDFKEVKEWVPIGAELDAHPVQEVPPASSTALKFWGK